MCLLIFATYPACRHEDVLVSYHCSMPNCLNINKIKIAGYGDDCETCVFQKMRADVHPAIELTQHTSAFADAGPSLLITSNGPALVDILCQTNRGDYWSNDPSTTRANAARKVAAWIGLIPMKPTQDEGPSLSIDTTQRTGFVGRTSSYNSERFSRETEPPTINLEDILLMDNVKRYWNVDTESNDVKIQKTYETWFGNVELMAEHNQTQMTAQDGVSSQPDWPQSRRDRSTIFHTISRLLASAAKDVHSNSHGKESPCVRPESEAAAVSQPENSSEPTSSSHEMASQFPGTKQASYPSQNLITTFPGHSVPRCYKQVEQPQLPYYMTYFPAYQPSNPPQICQATHIGVGTDASHTRRMEQSGHARNHSTAQSGPRELPADSGQRVQQNANRDSQDDHATGHLPQPFPHPFSSLLQMEGSHPTTNSTPNLADARTGSGTNAMPNRGDHGQDTSTGHPHARGSTLQWGRARTGYGRGRHGNRHWRGNVRWRG